MLKIRLFSIYDSVAEVFEAPFYARTRGEGERIFTDVLKIENQKYCQHPEHYSLFEIGTFDIPTGFVEGLKEGPISMGNAVSFLRKEA